MFEGGKIMNEDDVCRRWPRSSVLEALKLDFCFTNDPWVRFMQAKGCSRARSASLPGRGLIILVRSQMVLVGKVVCLL